MSYANMWNIDANQEVTYLYVVHLHVEADKLE